MSMYQTNILIAELERRGYLRILWQKDDVKERFKARFPSITLTGKELTKVCDYISRKWSSSQFGWDEIDAFTDQVMEDINPKKFERMMNVLSMNGEIEPEIGDRD